MGNQMSVPQRLEDQENESETDTHKVMPESECHQNGMLVVSQPHPVQQYDEVDLGASVREDHAATASPTTTEISTAADASGKSLGKEAKPQAPAARSRFFLTLSRPVPGRAGDQATDSSTGSVKLDVSSSQAPRNKDLSEPGALPGAAAPGRDPDKTPGPTPAAQLGLSATWGPESGGAAPSKPKDPSFFDKLFKLDKEREQTPVDSQQEAKCAQHQDQARETPGSSTQSSDVPAEGDIADGRRREGQEITTVSCSVPGDPEELETAKEDPQTENNNSIMSFFKTLVSPSKAETKKDLEDTDAEKSPTTPADIKSDQAHVTPQEPQGAAKNSTSTEAAKEGAKEKGGPTSLPLGKLFWKKSVKEDSVPTGAEENVVCESAVEVKSEEVDAALHTVDLSEEGDSAPEPAEVTPKREERKPQRPSLMAFLRQMSVKGDGGTTHSEEINGKDSSYQTSESPEKAAAPPEPEPAAAAQKGKDGSSKDKKAAAEPSKQEAREPAPSAEPAAAEANSLQNGDKSQKRPEKRRQSLGGFFKGLGPKRMSDAQVQTDPVSIGPVGKSK
ncbi:breast carcinoma-amplified sequence 1 isoform X3 [Camelus ferus]|uniref:Breast carcinoma-amplified sequence 1 isoform X3 n=1 Tax=Camelus ferus TaxID=419612 RepID=A0A8B8RHD4_CAMFR|nr:breast carcinoma-amplified sequence 1 isoform X3 [Camelus ferus]